MECFIKMEYIMEFPNLFMARMDCLWILKGPFPTHDLKFSGEIDAIHYVGTKIEWRKVFCGGGSLLTMLVDGSV